MAATASPPVMGSERGQTPYTGRLKVAGWLLLAAACAADGPRQVSNSGAGAFEAALAATEDGFVVAWYDVRDGNPEIYSRLLTGSGRPADRERRLTNDSLFSYEADIQAVGMNLAVAWYDKDPDGRLQAHLGLWTRDGRQLWTRSISSPRRSGRNPSLTIHDAELFVAWLEDSGADASDVWAGWWNLAGQAASEPVMVGPASRTTWNLNTDVDDAGRGWIAFDARAGTQSDELFLAIVERDSDRVSGSGMDGASGFSRTVDLRRLTADDGSPSKYPDVALSGPDVALTWYDERDGNQEVYLAIVGADLAGVGADETGAVVGETGVGAGLPGRRSAEREGGSRPGIESRARRVTNTPGNSIGAYAAWNGDTVGLAWSDDSDGGQHDVFFQPFTRDGAPLTGPRRITDNPTASLIPSIRAARGVFALAWNEYTAPPGDGHGSTGRSEIAFTVVR